MQLPKFLILFFFFFWDPLCYCAYNFRYQTLPADLKRFMSRAFLLIWNCSAENFDWLWFRRQTFHVPNLMFNWLLNVWQELIVFLPPTLSSVVPESTSMLLSGLNSNHHKLRVLTGQFNSRWISRLYRSLSVKSLIKHQFLQSVSFLQQQNPTLCLRLCHFNSSRKEIS